ncbi:SDR family oxidoreductase [Oricola sp.]|uniref:SDR family oxidoreductase n=1 Tax=Oricola sp. TaxID=1979950 RepID=UPI00351919F6
MRFAGKTVIVTGAAGNLGSAVAKRFAEEGASVALFGHRLEKVEAVANELAGNHAAFGVDLTDREASKKAVAEVTEKLGPPAIVCAIAGGFDMGTPVHEVPAEDWQKMMDLNLGTLLSVLAAVTPGMIERGAGKIVTIGANGAKSGGKTMGPYAASKSAVMRVTESASAELKSHGINVNSVLPSIIDTPENRDAMPKAEPAKWVTPESLAGVIAFLCSDDAKDIHGALVPVTGLS